VAAIQKQARPAAASRWWLPGAALLAVGFGLLTLWSGGNVLFGGEDARAAAGNYVPFVVVFNFAAGFAYVLAGIGLWWRQHWAAWLALAIAVATALVFAAFALHVYTGGAYQLRTVIAMSFRTALWAAIALLAWRQLLRRKA